MIYGITTTRRLYATIRGLKVALTRARENGVVEAEPFAVSTVDPSKATHGLMLIGEDGMPRPTKEGRRIVYHSDMAAKVAQFTLGGNIRGIQARPIAKKLAVRLQR
tara:strand:- start:8934 stop:9251 length:318 start_codon:yes stop_codon:yes gene_type:complete